MNSKVERTGSLITILATPANVRLNTDALFRYERTRRIRYIVIEHTTSIQSISTIAKILLFTHYICFDSDLFEETKHQQRDSVRVRARGTTPSDITIGIRCVGVR